MAMPFYVSPEQVMKDRADYARKGIARGRSIVAVESGPGILIVAENPSSTLHKVGELYDRIAFAAVGKYNEFENLRIAGVRMADMKGYSYGREDVTAKAIANAYAQAIGSVFTEQMKPFEVEVLVAQVGATQEQDELYRVVYDGSLYDETGFMAMGGHAETLVDLLRQGYQPGLDLPSATRLGIEALRSAGGDERELDPDDLEVALLAREAPRRAFRRLDTAEITQLLQG
jgi:proteasome alpha subunit